MKKDRHILNAGGSTAVRVSMVLALVATLGACRSDQISHYSPDMLLTSGHYKGTPAEKFPIHVHAQELKFSLPVSSGPYGMDDKGLSRLNAYLHYYHSQAAGPLYISVPTSSYRGGDVQTALQVVRKKAKDFAISQDRLVIDHYGGSGNSTPIINMTFKRKFASATSCHLQNRNLAWEYPEIDNENVVLGCVQQHNLATMVANPEDLQGAAGWSPRSSARRDMVYQKYEAGEPSAATRSSDEKTNSR